MLSILGIVVIIVATYQVYKTARDTGRNPAIWALITFVVGAGIQIALPIVAVMIYAGILLGSGTPAAGLEEAVSTFSIVVTLIGLALSLAAVWLILRMVSKIPEEKSFAAPPAPPTDFNQNG
jgi:hypothetical protein